MEVNVNQPILSDHPSAKRLISHLEDNSDAYTLTDAIVYHNLLINVNSDASTQRSDVIIVSKNHGIVLFKCLDQTTRTLTSLSLDEAIANFGQMYSIVYSKLLKNSNIRINPTTLKVNLKPAMFIEYYNYSANRPKISWEDLEVITDLSNLNYFFNDIKIEKPLDETLIKEILSVLEGSEGLIKRRKRVLEHEGKKTKGVILERMEQDIAIFDADQKRAALFIIDGPQRIRGLAGSGKTIVLAMKAAQIHAAQPDAKILYTYWTKQLHDYIKRLITRFYRENADHDPDWTKIDIMHAWGGKNLEGVYYNTCINNNIPPLTYGDVKVYGKKAFDQVCKSLMRYNLKESYDYSILDEAQDFPVYFYRLCRKITKNDRVIWGYDECQNILDIELQDTIKTFGKKTSGDPYIDFSKSSEKGQDIVLQKCYRNTRTCLVTGFALGLGIYSDKIIQLPENKELWGDWGFKIIEGDYKTGDRMVIIRPEENSPLLKNKLVDQKHESVNWKIFGTFEDECQFVADNILKDLKEDLLPDDIMVLSLDDITARKYFKAIAGLLDKEDIKTFNLLEAPPSTTKFKVEGYITLTTVYRAKGNEAGSVYIVGVDRIFQRKNLVKERNKLFTAITRANAWVTISGMGQFASHFEKEIKEVVNNDFKLIFEMPDLAKLKKFRRDLAYRQVKFNEAERMLETIAVDMGIDKEALLKELIGKSEYK